VSIGRETARSRSRYAAGSPQVGEPRCRDSINNALGSRRRLEFSDSPGMHARNAGFVFERKLVSVEIDRLF
jgi:hypothetical protein